MAPLRDDSPAIPYPGYFAQVRTEILPFVRPNVTSVIDIGGGNGSTLSLIKSRFPSAKTICVDAHRPSLSIAAQNGHVTLECDLNSATPDIIAECDVVLCLDILEHLVDPWTVLQRIARKMKPGSDIIISLPNVRFLPVSAGLLFRGSWELVDAGILDRTHLRFFTRRSAIALIEGAGLNLNCIEPQIGGGRKTVLANALTLGIFRDVLTVQYLLFGSR